MDRVAVSDRELQAYTSFVPEELSIQVRELGRSLEGQRVIHINATPRGGGVAEILQAFVPLMRDVGVDADWYVPQLTDSFFAITKDIHNFLQGKEGYLSQEQIDYYLLCNQEAAKQLDPLLTATDLLIIHDPQFLPLRAYLQTPCPSVWVCHIDTTSANDGIRDLMLPYVRLYDRMVFSMEDYVFPGLDRGKVHIIPPAIDPLSPKNVLMPFDQARDILAGLGIDPQRRLMTQVSRFDAWKDPWGVVDSYRIAKQVVPELQLALVGVFEAQDDPESMEVFRSVQKYVNGEQDIHLFTDPDTVKAREINSFQRGSDVIVQKSIREGFGLTVAEAMLKGTPVIGGDCGGIRLQIRDGETGFLVNGAANCAERVVDLLQDNALAQRIGRAGSNSASLHYLIPRLLRDYLSLSSELLSPTPVGSSEIQADRDHPSNYTAL